MGSASSIEEGKTLALLGEMEWEEYHLEWQFETLNITPGEIRFNGKDIAPTPPTETDAV